jgi:Kef-type K+ transport system membrane component KefB
MPADRRFRRPLSSSEKPAKPRFAASGTVLAYVAMIAAAALVFWLVLARGEGLVATGAPGPARPAAAAAGAPVNTLLHVLLALVVVIVCARLLGAVFARLHQPPVMGEVLAGILLGPSLLGAVAPDVGAFILPPAIGPHLAVLAQVGVILFMFLVGVELDLSRLRRHVRSAVAISHASIVLPFVLGAGLALWLYPTLAGQGVAFSVFALFLGVSLSVTAFPVLARILTDRKLQRTQIGVIALTCAAVGDVTAWCMLAFVVGVVNARAGDAAITVALAAGYVVVMVAVVRPLAVRFTRAQEGREITQATMVVVLTALLASALATEAIGIHAIFGAFLLGALVPHDSRLAHEVTHKLEAPVVIVLLPAFFAFIGMRTEIGLVSGAEQWAICAAVIGVACAGKFGGSFLAGVVTGLGWRPAAAVGVLMNTRGLMELIVLDVGLDLGVLSPVLFAMLVIMAVVTTLATTPILHLLTRRTAEL